MVPAQLRPRIMEVVHGSIKGGHLGIKSDGQEISTIEGQELKNRFPSFFAHK